MKLRHLPENTEPNYLPAPVASPQYSAADALQLVFDEYSPNTKRAYARIFRNFQDWIGIEKLQELSFLDSLKMLEYKNYLRSEGKKPASINQTMSALKKICEVLTEFGYLEANPFKSSVIRTEKVSGISNKGALRVAQLSAMMEANSRMEYDERLKELIRLRNGLILRFLYLTAARRSEASQLLWENIKQNGSYYVAIIQQTKSGVPQQLKLRNELYFELQQWRQTLSEHEIKVPWVFPSLSYRTMGEAMSGKGVNDVIVRLGKAVGLDISAHYLRHTAITIALDLGEPLQKVQAYARHVSANTTIRYYHDQEVLAKNPTDKLPMI
ncbi:site-specific integrase [Deltaproteobacteria bacterium TL4]